MAIDIEVRATLSEESIKEAADKILKEVNNQRTYRVGAVRRHPKERDLFAVWSGVKWFVFNEDSPTLTTIVDRNSATLKWSGLKAEDWDEYYP